jgi:sodium/potassium-transporting ATPase subunit alpha
LLTTLLLKSLESVAFLDRSMVDVKSSLAKSSEAAAPALKSLVEVARLCNGASFVDADDAIPISERSVKGDATDTAILRFAAEFTNGHHGIDVDKMVESHDKLFELPFNSKNKWMLTVVRENKGASEKVEGGEPIMLVKGAPDVLFSACGTALKADGCVVPFDGDVFRQVSALQSEWASEGQRVLALCKKSLGGINVDFSTSANEVEEMMYSQMRGLTLVGLVGIRDPPRVDVKGAIQVIRRAG